MLTLTLVSIHGMMGRIYAIEQPSTMEGINEQECDKVVNCKIISENVIKYPDRVNPFDKNEDISMTMMNNLNNSQKIAGEKSCQKLMDVDIEKINDQQFGEQTPNYSICLP
jgi:uncharacterized protein (UPF0276 family)